VDSPNNQPQYEIPDGSSVSAYDAASAHQAGSFGGGPEGTESADELVEMHKRHSTVKASATAYAGGAYAASQAGVHSNRGKDGFKRRKRTGQA
jgi:hypothetical protein